MKKPLIFICFLFTLIIVISVGNTLFFYSDDSEEQITPKITKVKEKNYDTVNKKSPQINVYNASENRVVSMNIEEYLYGVLSSEMPSSFDLEALKAQAVAARTYVIYKVENNITSGHENASVCTNPSHCQAYSSYEQLKEAKGETWIKNDYSLVKKAVNQTKGQIVTYEGKAILPLYFSTSSGKTEDSKEVFQTGYPYLVSVESPYESKSPKYKTTYSINKSEFIKKMKSAYSNLVLSSQDVENQVSIINRTEGGGVKTIQVGNIKLAGTQLRKILNLNSANFDIDYEGDQMNFLVKGYGHGVGMSQWGAQGMATKGYKYYDILLHYYESTKILDTY